MLFCQTLSKKLCARFKGRHAHFQPGLAPGMFFCARFVTDLAPNELGHPLRLQLATQKFQGRKSLHPAVAGGAIQLARLPRGELRWDMEGKRLLTAREKGPQG